MTHGERRRRSLRRRSATVPVPEAARPPLALWVENLTVSFDGFKALTDVTLTLEKGELRCLIGPNGAGKTTLMDVHHRQDAPRQRRRLPRNRLTRADRAVRGAGSPQLGIGRKFQRPTVFQGHTVYENCELALHGQQGRLPRAVRAPHRRRARRASTRSWSSIGLAGPRQAPGGPAGARAEAVAGDRHAAGAGSPKVLLVDEPVAGMTHAEMERTAELLREPGRRRTRSSSSSTTWSSCAASPAR